MTRDSLNAFCASLPHATHVLQWGQSDVYKIGGKVFAIVGTCETGATVTFKVSHLGFELLLDGPGSRPAPYLASRGLKWIQYFSPAGMWDDSLQEHIRASYDMVAAGLTRKLRAALALDAPQT